MVGAPIALMALAVLVKSRSYWLRVGRGRSEGWGSLESKRFSTLKVATLNSPAAAGSSSGKGRATGLISGREIGSIL